MPSASKSPTAVSRQASRSALRPGAYDETRTMIQGLVIFNPRPNPQFVKPCMTCAAFGSPRVSCKLSFEGLRPAKPCESRACNCFVFSTGTASFDPGDARGGGDDTCRAREALSL